MRRLVLTASLLAALTAPFLLLPTASAASELIVGLIASRTLAPGAAQTLVGTAWASEVRAGGGVFGVPVELLMADDGGDPQRAAELAEGQIANGALALVCCTTTVASRAVAAVAEAAGVALLAPAPFEPADRQNYWAFSLAPSDTDALAAIVADAYRKGRSSLALLAPDLPLTATAGDQLVALGAIVGIRLVADERYPAGQSELRPEALLVASNRPGAVVVWGFADDLENAVSALRRRGYEGDVYGRSLPFFPGGEPPAGARVADMLVAAPPAAALAGDRGLARSLDDPDAVGPCTAAATEDAARLAEVPGAARNTLVTAPVLAGLDLLRSAFEQVLALQIPTNDAGVLRQAVRDALVGLPPTCTGAGSIDLEDGRTSAVQPRGLVMIEVTQTGLTVR